MVASKLNGSDKCYEKSITLDEHVYVCDSSAPWMQVPYA